MLFCTDVFDLTSRLSIFIPALNFITNFHLMASQKISEFPTYYLKKIHKRYAFLIKTSFTISFVFSFNMLAGNDNIANTSPADGRSERNTISVGVAKVNITPSIPVVMSGYASRTEPFKGIKDSLFATAVVFNDGANKAVIITAEVIGFSHEVWEELTGRIEKETGIPGKFVMLAPVHNHGGPSTRVYENKTDENLLSYNQELKDKLVRITKEAAANLQPALIGSGKGICKMNINRRALNASGRVWLGSNPYGPCDHEVGVVRIDDTSGTPFSLFVNWPTHATVMGGGNYMITGDWPGAARRFIEREFPVPVIASITAGASGDINPIYRVLSTFSANEMEEIGMVLGQEVIRVADEIKTYKASSIKAVQRVITLPGKKTGGSHLPQDFYESGPDVDVRLSLLRVGNIVFAGVSGELFTEIGMAIKELSPFSFTHVITHCNGSSGYLITDSAYKEGGYEVSVTRIMSGAEKGIIANLMEMMYEID
jgi:neutral ceramidase